jgi:hypothetical protein
MNFKIAFASLFYFHGIGRIGGVNHPIFLDAPVSGGILGAEAGILTFMVSSYLLF